MYTFMCVFFVFCVCSLVKVVCIIRINNRVYMNYVWFGICCKHVWWLDFGLSWTVVGNQTQGKHWTCVFFVVSMFVCKHLCIMSITWLCLRIWHVCVVWYMLQTCGVTCLRAELNFCQSNKRQMKDNIGRVFSLQFCMFAIERLCMILCSVFCLCILHVGLVGWVGL